MSAPECRSGRASEVRVLESWDADLSRRELHLSVARIKLAAHEADPTDLVVAIVAASLARDDARLDAERERLDAALVQLAMMNAWAAYSARGADPLCDLTVRARDA